MNKVLFVLMLIVLTGLGFLNYKLYTIPGLDTINYRMDRFHERLNSQHHTIRDLDQGVADVEAKFASLINVINQLNRVHNDCVFVANYLKFTKPVVVDLDEINHYNLDVHCHLTRNDNTEIIISAEDLRSSVKNYKADVKHEEEDK